MAAALVDPVAAALCTRPEPLGGRPLVHPGTAHDERGRVEARLLGIGDSARQDLADGVARRLRREGERRLCLVGRHPADEVHHPAGLARRDAHVPRLCPRFHLLSRSLSSLKPELPRCLHYSSGYRRLRRSSRTWLRKVRVGANSPSLCPTIDSVMNTGTCLRPSCTAIVWPSIAGTIMDRRDQVLITFLVPLSFCRSTFLIRWSSTNGPFFRLRGIMGCSYRFFLPRLRVISRSLGLCALRVRPSGLPHGLTGWRPPELLPSPPPSGGSTGLMATPRTEGRLPFPRFRPALPSLMLPCSALPTSPIVARQVASTSRISPDGMRRWATLPSLASSCTPDPAERAILAPPSGRSSMACTTVPFGSYSMCATLAGTPSLSFRLKSISRYARLCPPPWCRAVMRPCTFLPPLECSGRTSDFSGSVLVTSEKSAPLAPRLPGVVGLYLRIAMCAQAPMDRPASLTGPRRYRSVLPRRG